MSVLVEQDCPATSTAALRGIRRSCLCWMSRNCKRVLKIQRIPKSGSDCAIRSIAPACIYTVLSIATLRRMRPRAVMAKRRTRKTTLMRWCCDTNVDNFPGRADILKTRQQESQQRPWRPAYESGALARLWMTKIRSSIGMSSTKGPPWGAGPGLGSDSITIATSRAKITIWKFTSQDWWTSQVGKRKSCRRHDSFAVFT
mmetsp:Transcript_16178/g.46467  ORF Transcript_16178/g.46467 Transcript_16178/m.46467 type:complete len:200 (+) Transcript_16178:507-1106(+)